MSTAVLRRAPTHVRAPAPRKKTLSAPRESALRQKTRHCPKPLTFSEMDIIIIKHTKSACLAQPVEHAAVNRSVGGSSPSTGAIVAARRTSQHLAQQRGVFACMPAAPLRVAKMQDVRCAPRSCGTIAPLSHFCSARRLRRGFFPFYRFFLEPPDAVFALHDSRVQISWRKHAIPSRLALLTWVESAGRRHRRRKAIVAEPRASARGFCILSCAKPHRKFFRRGPRFMPHRKYFRRGPRGSSSRRKNARRSLCSSFLRNYRAALSFLLRAAASPWFLSFLSFLSRTP